MTKKANAAEQLSANAERILTYSRKVLTAEIPELMPAFFLLRCDRTDVPGGLYTDGSTLYYHPETVVQNYLQDKRSICRQLLHIVLHGLQGHFFKRQGQHEEIFDAVADAKTAYLMERFGYGSKKLPAGAQKLIWRTSKLSMETACFAVTKEEAKKLSAFAAALYSDDHSRWMPPARAGGNAGGGAGDGGWDQWSDMTVQCARQFARSPQWGDLAGAFSEVYREVEPSGVSYGEFLRRFLSVEEIAAVDPDSIDRIWYHIGLEYLGDVPFIEPDELREESERISLAVALDTSGSCCGAVSGVGAFGFCSSIFQSSAVITLTGQPSAAKRQSAFSSSETGTCITSALPSAASRKTAGQVETHSPQPMHPSRANSTFIAHRSFLFSAGILCAACRKYVCFCREKAHRQAAWAENLLCKLSIIKD